MNVRPIVSRPPFLPLGHFCGGDMRVSTRKRREMAGRDRPSLPLRRSVLAPARCSPLEEDSLLDTIPSYFLEMNIRGWVENDHISPKTQKRKSTRNCYPDLTDLQV